MRIALGIVVSCAAVCFSVSAQAQNFIVNGGFETPSDGFHPNGTVPGWTGWVGPCQTGTATPIEIWNSATSIQAHGGSQHLEISSNTTNQTVCQTVTGLMPGCPTTLTFWSTGRPGFTDDDPPEPYENHFNLSLSGSYTHSVGYYNSAYNPAVGDDWKQHTVPFVPGAGDLTISFFKATDDIGGAHIDDVKLTQNCTEPIADDHLYCYKVRDRFKPNSIVSIVDQFGVHHGVKVIKPYLLCTAAKKCVETRCICANGRDAGPFMPTMPPGTCNDLCTAAGETLPGQGVTLSCDGRCGNDFVEPGCCEECDDGNQVGGDGCSPLCQSE